MNNSKFTLFNLLYDIATDWIQQEKKTKSSIIGSLIKTIEKKGKLRDAQVQAIIIYLWLKEKGNTQPLSKLINSGAIFQNNKLIFYKGDIDYQDKPAKRYLNRYLQDVGIQNLDDYLRINVDYEEYSKLINNLFEDFAYPNYLFSLPMGAGKTFLMAAFIYIDMYMYLKTNDKDKYSSNFIILAPSSRKTSILPSLRTIKLFDPKWLLPESDANNIKKLLKIEVLDDSAKNDKLQNQNPNLAKIMRTIHSHEVGNVFILNAEKVIPESIPQEEFEQLNQSQQTRISRAEKIKDALSKLKNIEVFLDEAHHSYSSDSETKKLRMQLNIINKENNIKCCIGMSGTPYISRKIKFQNKLLKLNDIQDIVYYYPLTDAIGNFLKTPIIKKVESDEKLLITTALTNFFKNYDKIYENGVISKIAFYCPSIDALNEKILPVIYEWYEKNGRNKNEILRYYTNTSKKYPLPSENLIHFLNLDNATSKFRIVLLVAVGTEGWDCKSLTSVVLPRQKSAKNFVLQTTCRCLREVIDAKNEKALIYLDSSNYKILDDELNANYHLHISDINNKEKNYKNYPIYIVKDNLGKIKYKEIYEKYIEISENINDDFKIKNALKKFNINKFMLKHPFKNQIGVTTITENGLNESISYKNVNNDVDFNYDFIDFIYEIEKSSFGNITSAKLIKYKNELKKIYNSIIKEQSWIYNHPSISTYDICKDISSIFAKKVSYKKEIITNDISINFLNWDVLSKPIIRVNESDKNLVFPANSYDDIEVGDEYYEENIEELKRRYNNKMKIPNKEKSFNYLPYKMDSTYEYNFLLNSLQNMDDKEIELYYNGYKNHLLDGLTIITPYGKYTPDFVLIKRMNGEISNIMLIETKAEPFETKAKEMYIKNVFLKNNKNYSYIKIGNVEDDINEYNKMIKMLEDFSK